MGRDQGDNAARVEGKGAGLRLPATASESEIASAAARLILEPDCRLAARRLGEAIAADVDGAGLVREMEAIAAMRRQDLVLEDRVSEDRAPQDRATAVAKWRRTPASNGSKQHHPANLGG
jgi:UDP:flavonoid glycosyltransferase YjiC (YdhE family)